MKKIFQSILSNPVLLFIFSVIVLITPNLFLLFTEPLSLSTRVAFIFLPLGFYIIWMIALRRLGWMGILSLPFMILGAFQLVLLYLFGNSFIAIDMFTNVVTTNAGEASELLGSIWPSIIGVCILYIPFLVWSTANLFYKTTLSSVFRIKAFKAGAILMIIGGAAACYSSYTNVLFEFNRVIFPLNVMNNINQAVKRWHLSKNYPQNTRTFTFNSKQTKKSDKREVYLFIIGETSRSANWELAGYDRETNPLLKQRNDILFFRDGITQSNTTHKSVPLILSAVNADNYMGIYKQKSIITAFKEAGFRTLYISNQVPNRSLIDYFSEEADQRIDLSPINNDLYKENLPDGNALQIIKEQIEADDKNLFIVFHSYGSHFNYQHRYPKDMAYFKPDNANTVSTKTKNHLINAYDNSIRYVDYVLNSAIEILNDSSICSAMFYTSDHGEDIMDDSRNKFLHASPIPTYYQLHIPLVIWFNNTYLTENREHVENARSNVNKPVSTANCFNTITDLANIETDYSDLSYSIVSKAFLSRNRKYVTDHNEDFYFFNMGLDDIDLKMLDLKEIYYNKNLYKKPIY
ncbi:MAG: sulfatase-like hydrolase/transferase [Bacteroidales bacterium]